MALKELQVPGVGPVVFQKRRRTKSIRIHIHGSEVRITMPLWASFVEATRFVSAKKDWINKHRAEKQQIGAGTYIGKQHQIIVKSGEALKTRITDTQILLTLPSDVDINDDLAQSKLLAACERALKRETEQLIVPRLKDLAYEHDFKLKNTSVKKLKRRWGSCDREHNVTLNIFLAQLPWEYIDYVLFHELTHIEHFSHDRAFWESLESHYPNAKKVRLAMKDYQPHIVPR